MMKKSFWILACILGLYSCHCLSGDLALKYDPIGPAVLEATQFLIAEHPEGPPVGFMGEDYKSLLLKYSSARSYSLLKPYNIQIEITGKDFIVHVYEGSQRILIDMSTTPGRIDYWCYKGECNKNGWLLMTLPRDFSM
jgi:hypothetical protein